MSDNFDEWLNSLDLGASASVEATARVDTPQEQTESDQVHFHMPDGDVIDVPIIHEEAPVETVSVLQQPTTVPIVSNISIIANEMININAVINEPFGNSKPPLNTAINTELSL